MLHLNSIHFIFDLLVDELADEIDLQELVSHFVFDVEECLTFILHLFKALFGLFDQTVDLVS